MASNRRLVPMPTKRKARVVTDRILPVERVAPSRQHWTDGLAAKIRNTNPWILFGWLAITAVVYAYAGKLVLLILGVVLLWRGWMFLCRRHPRTAWFIFWFLRGLLGGRRR